MNAPASNPASRAGYPGLVLAMLLLVYTFNFLDRQILGILAKPIMEDLQLTRTEFGAIGGLAFAVLYSVLGVPLAYLADRTSRSGVIAGALAVWSLFTGLCGVATGYWQLFLFRLGVGVGEAGGVAPSYAVIADYFPPEKRARALAIYSLGIPIGLALGTLLGAYIAALVNWRAAFITMGVIGILIAPIFRWVVRDVPRPVVAKGDAAPVSAVFGILARKPGFWLLAFGASCSSLCGYGLALWTPLVLMGNFGFDLVTTGQFMASLLLIGGTAGVFAGGWFADRLGKGDRAWYAWLPAIAWLITAPLFAVGFLTSNPWIAWPLLVIPNGLNILWLGPVTTAVQHMVPQHMRATASGSFLMINNLIGMGLGPLLMGFLGEALKASYGAEALRYGAVFCLGFYVLAGILALFAAKHVRSGWVEQTA
ncbi:putative MFS family arabinose efflux permease [Sphingomonas kyeonggiensis]|uniref:Putative MFS family arabinose efflux permease n=1 Tax=Sphingomonas kyeonggiensis TaxID=1268553 RepID=A0A7W7NRN0_9SPHN|nr:MFS transporter [Sphingomonas kyeonggiensis]MBB4837784.1 putative MFS family arabinose efflux permease [Sphingomonas kyeonggiensis]